MLHRTALFSVLFAALAPALPAMAQTLDQAYFGNPALASRGCYHRAYDRAHLAAHPDQITRSITLRPSALPDEPGMILLDVFITVRGRAGEYQRTAYCDTFRDRMDCWMEGDAGGFTLTAAKRDTLRLTVAPAGMGFEGRDFLWIEGQSGDDRVFLIPNAPAGQCN